MSERKINPGGQSGQNGNLWMRGLMMLIFIFCLWVARFVLLTVALFQFLNLLLTSNTNQKAIGHRHNAFSYCGRLRIYAELTAVMHPNPEAVYHAPYC